MSSSVSASAPSPRLGERIREWVPAVVVFALGLVAWQWLLPDVLGVEDFLLPRFSDVVGALIDERDLLLRGAWITLKEAVSGFILGSGATTIAAPLPRASRVGDLGRGGCRESKTGRNRFCAVA